MIGDDSGSIAAGEWRLNWRLSGTGVDTTLESKRRGNGDVSGDLSAGDLRGKWRQRQKIGDDIGEEWRRQWRLCCWGLETAVKTGYLADGEWRRLKKLSGWESTS